MSSVSPLILLVVVVALIIGELVFRRLPGAGGLLYNFAGTLAGLIWILAGVFLVWGGSWIIGAVVIIIGLNIHRSNYRIASGTISRSNLNG